MSRWRRRCAVAARAAAAILVIAATSGVLPRLLLVQAAIAALLTMILAPVCLLDRDPARRPAIRVPAFIAVFLLSAGDIAIQAAPVAEAVAQGGAVAALVMSALVVGAVAFWSVVIPPARIGGLAAGGYVVAGSLPISMPAMFLILAQRDLYPGLHPAGATLLDGRTDQLLAGFVLFATVKVTVFVAFTILFVAASREPQAGDDDHGGHREAGPGPGLPGWAKGLGPASPAVEEPAASLPERVPAPAREPVRAGGSLRRG